MGDERRRRRPASALLAVGLMVVSTACSRAPVQSESALQDDAITVASFNFPESELLAELYAQALEAAGFRVHRQLDLGTRELVEPALERGLVELVPEYTGSLLEFLAGPDSAGPNAVEVKQRLTSALRDRGIVALQTASAQDRNGFVVTRATARRYGLRRLSDLGPVAGTLSFGGPPECQVRPLCLPGLSAVYGLTFERFVPLDASGPVTIAALTQDEVQVALVFTSDGAISANHLVLLRDDRHLQPAENVVPVVREEVLQRFGPRVPEVLDAVSALLTTETLRELNADVSTRGRSPRAVASDWLHSHGLAGPVG